MNHRDAAAIVADAVSLLRGWIRIDGADPSELGAVGYFAAIERAYTRALRADAGYAELVQQNPFSASYETFSGRDEPYSLRELAAFVELPPLAPRRMTLRPPPSTKFQGRLNGAFSAPQYVAHPCRLHGQPW